MIVTNENDFLNNLLQTNRQVTSLPKAFATKSSKDITCYVVKEGRMLKKIIKIAFIKCIIFTSLNEIQFFLFFNRDLYRRCLVYMFSLRFSGSKFLILNLYIETLAFFYHTVCFSVNNHMLLLLYLSMITKNTLQVFCS